MRPHTDEFYEGILQDVLQLDCKPTLKGKALSDDIKDGIDTTLNAIGITEDEENILQLKYDSLMSNKEIGDITGVTAQKVASQVKNIAARIRTSSKMLHFLRGQHEGEVNDLYALTLFNSQKALKETGGYDDYSEEIKSLDLRYLAILGLTENELFTLYKEGFEDIGSVAQNMRNEQGSLETKKILSKSTIIALKEQFEALGLN